MSEQEIKLAVIGKSKDIAKLLFKGKDVELRKDANGIKVISVEKKVVTK